MPSISGRSPQTSVSNTNSLDAQGYASSAQTPDPAERTIGARNGRPGNPRLDAITVNSSDKKKRRAVRAIAADYERLHLDGIDACSLDAFLTDRDRYIEALTVTQTKLAQIIATGLTERAPGISISRSVKNGAAFVGGATSRVGQVVAGGTAVAGTVAATAAALPYSLVLGSFELVFDVVSLEFLCPSSTRTPLVDLEGIRLLVSPYKSAYRFLKSDRLANTLRNMNALPRALAYVRRPRLPTARIAATTAAQISEELLRFYSGVLSDDERAFIDDQTVGDSRDAIEPAMDAPWFEAVEIPAPVLPTIEPSRWHFPETEDNAAVFNAFQARITATAEYRNPLSKPGLVRRVDVLVEAMRASPALRAACFDIALDSVQSCGDRVALGLNDMEQALLIDNAERGQYSAHDLFHHGLGCFKKQVLDEITIAKIADMHRRDTPVDEIEVRLAFPTELCDRLALPGVTREMHYRRSAKVSASEIAAAERTVREKIAQGKAIDFLTQWRPWCKAMEKSEPEAFRALEEAAQLKRDPISTMPAHMTDREWMTAFADLKAEEETKSAELLKRTTLQFIARHGLQMV